ncbi:MAG: hypothetical protein GF307_11290 [candidate division Zixibacteria bacterium]|nr:hypothetical protein [candidate division Zixibacteria bacterium]
MFCPNCRYEYVDVVTRCPNCGVELVRELPADTSARRYSYLKAATILSIIGITYIFLLRNVATITPELFRNTAMGQYSVITMFLADLLILFFFIQFYREFAPRYNTRLKTGSIFGIIGALLLLPEYFIRMVRIFLIGNPFGSAFPIIAVDAVLPWISSILFLVFFTYLYMEMYRAGHEKLKEASLWAVLGSAMSFLVLTYTLINYILLGGLAFMLIKVTNISLLLLPFTAAGFAATIYFYIVFYRQLNLESTQDSKSLVYNR